MSELTIGHLDDFTLLRYSAGDLDREERHSVEAHLRGCSACAAEGVEIARLDRELQLAARSASFPAADPAALSATDPFRERPSAATTRKRLPREAVREAISAADRARELQQRLLDVSSEPARIVEELRQVRLDRAEGRFAVLYALQEGGRRIAESPSRMLRLADAVMDRLRGTTEETASEESETLETILPRLVLFAQAHVLAGQGCNWTGDLEKAGVHFEIAYRSFGRAGGDEISLATVEHLEAQRRAFLDRGAEALLLASRAAATFEEFGLDDRLARAKVCQGLAFFALGQQETAIECYRAALPVFESEMLWSNYVTTLNSIATSYEKLGRLDDARREYARALRSISREEHRSVVAFIRHGLATLLFKSDRFREAAISFGQASRLYAEAGLHPRAIIASLYEIESWARSSDEGRARHRLEILRTELQRHPVLDGSVAARVQAAFAGATADLAMLAETRREAEASLRGAPVLAELA